MRAIGHVGDLALINILFLLCSIPVFTLGASAAALNTVLFPMIRGEEKQIVRTFFAAFKRNLRQGALLTLLFLVIGAGLYLDLRVTQANPAAVPFVLRIGMGLLGLFAALTMPVSFALLARFDNTIGNTLKNAFVLAITHPLVAVASAALALLPVALLLFWPYYLLLSSVFWFLFGFSLIAAAICWMIERVLRPILPDASPDTKQND